MYLSHIRKDQREKLSRKVKVKYSRPIGTSDILPQHNNFAIKTKIYDASQYVAQQTGHARVTTPNIETFHLYKKLFDKHEFIDNLIFLSGSKDNPMVLKPEMTISIARAHVESGLHLDTEPREYWYYEKLYHQQKKQFREFYRFGIEIYKESDPVADANLLYITSHFLNILGLQGQYTIHINNIGSTESQDLWVKEIKSYFKDKLKKLPAEVKKILDHDTLKILSFQDEDVQLHLLNGPKIIDFIDNKSLKSYETIKEFLTFAEIEFKEDMTYIPDMPYYEGNVFGMRIMKSKNKPPIELARGGRYKNIVEIIGGEPVDILGMYVDTDVLENVLKELQVEISTPKVTEIFIAHLGPNSRKYALKLVKQFREMGIGIKESIGNSSLRQQIKEAQKLNATYMILLGEKELEDGEVIIKNLELEDQQNIPLDQIFNIISNYLSKKDVKKFNLK